VFSKWPKGRYVELHPEQTVGYDESMAASAPPLANNNLISQSDELKLQRRAAADAEREQGNESGQNRDHAPRRYGRGASNSSIFLDGSQF
jgi:hypothetical protein